MNSYDVPIPNGFPLDPALAIQDRRRVPAARYTSRELFDLEAERLWSRVWQMACRLEEIPRVGDFVEYEILGKSILVVRVATDPESSDPAERTAPGAGPRPGPIKAFHNACRHRGMQLDHDRGHRPQGFTCPFHGWCWELDGTNKHVFAPNLFDQEQLDPDDLRLRECRVETWGGSAFVNFDDTAPPLRASLEPFATYHDAHKVEKMRAESWHSTVLPVNWKLACEAFMEGYHAEQTHPQLLARAASEGYGAGTNTAGFTDPSDVVESSLYFMKVLSEGMGGGMIHERDIRVAESLRGIALPDDPMEAIIAWNTRLNEEITQQSRAAGIDIPDLNDLVANGHISSVNFGFPNFFLLPVYGNAACYRVRPIGPEETLFEIWSTTLMPEDADPPRLDGPTFWAHDDPSWPDVVRQDLENLPRQQAGLRSPGFDSMRLSPEVEGLISNFHRAIDGYLADRPRDDLLSAIQKVSGGIDAPIATIEFD